MKTLWEKELDLLYEERDMVNSVIQCLERYRVLVEQTGRPWVLNPEEPRAMEPLPN